MSIVVLFYICVHIYIYGVLQMFIEYVDIVFFVFFSGQNIPGSGLGREQKQ